jgi:DNA-directed RNA polymerase subunit RPC12/RpoP
MSPLYNKSRRAERNVKGDDLMSDRIMRCDRCKKQTVHVREGRRFQIRSKIEVIFRCGICGETVRLLEKKPKNPPRGLNWRRPY